MGALLMPAMVLAVRGIGLISGGGKGGEGDASQKKPACPKAGKEVKPAPSYWQPCRQM